MNAENLLGGKHDRAYQQIGTLQSKLLRVVLTGLRRRCCERGATGAEDRDAGHRDALDGALVLATKNPEIALFAEARAPGVLHRPVDATEEQRTATERMMFAGHGSIHLVEKKRR